MILLVDMDSFFASVEQAHHPHLRGKPVVVCGDPSRRGVITAASYEARAFGLRAGMPLGEAKQLCPHAEYVEGNPEKYVAQSLELLDLYITFTPDVEPFSVDEAFVGLPRTTLEQAAAIARTIQSMISERFHLGASIGVGPNKLIAKMASGVSKPRGLTPFDAEAFCAHFWPLPVQELWGVGSQLATRMRSLGISTVGELAHAPVHVLKAAFGVIGPQLRDAARGHDETPLVPYHRGMPAKSMGHEVTLPRDSDDRERLLGILLRLSDQVARRLRGDGYVGRVVALKLRDHRFHTRIRQRALTEHTDDHDRIFTVIRTLFEELWDGKPVRLLGVTALTLERTPHAQSELFDHGRRKRDLRTALDEMRDQLGEASIVPAGSLIHRRRLGHVPFGAVGSQRKP
jgi:DNA polymerase-4